jgi:GMP synthase (glutamine-hydrolysing)
MTATAKRPILVILHQEHSTPGRIGLRLQARGHALDIRRPRFGDPLPDSLAAHAGAVVFGGPMSANDNDEYLARETAWMEVPLSENAPLLGVCLGAQLLARHLGAAVRPDPQGRVEIGYYAIAPTEPGRRLMGWPDKVHQFHREGFDLPLGATLLATGDVFPNQAFAYGACAFAIQFHIELTMAMVGRWTGRIGERAKLPGAQTTAEHLAGRALHDWKTATFLESLLDLWLASDRRELLTAAE